jgi:hypothetical protein
MTSTSTTNHNGDMIPKHRNIVNIYDLSPMDRKALGESAVIKIFAGTRFIMHVPKKLFVATSMKATTLLNDQGDIRLAEDTKRQHFVTSSIG